MKPIVKKKLAVFYPQGFLDGGNARSVIERIDIEMLKATKCEVVLVSLKKIVFFNQRGLNVVLEALQIIGNNLGACIGFCDYDDKKFGLIMDIYNSHLPFSLFDTEKIGLLFANSISNGSKDTKILVYNEDAEQKNQLVIELYELGYKPVVAKSEEEFEAKKDDFEYLIRHSHLGSVDRTIHIHIKNNVIVYTLKDFLDSSLVDDFDLDHHNNALKIGFTYFLFDCEQVASTNVHAVNFIAKLSTAGAEYGATIAISGLSKRSITEALKNDLEDAGVLIYNKMDDFFSDDGIFGEDGGGALSGKKPRHITKRLVEILPLVLQTASKVVESMSHLKLVKKNIKIQDLSVQEPYDMLGVAIAFYGQLEGMMVVAFHEKVARKVCQVLLEDDANKDELSDALGEIVNIIGGKLVQQMIRKKYKAQITMPRVYGSIEELIESKKGTKGAQVDFELDGNAVSMFLTR